MKKLPIINGVVIKSIEFFNGVYTCTGIENHIETILPEKMDIKIVELMKKHELIWICFSDEDVLEYETVRLPIVSMYCDDENELDEICKDIVETLLDKNFGHDNK